MTFIFYRLIYPFKYCCCKNETDTLIFPIEFYFLTISILIIAVIIEHIVNASHNIPAKELHTILYTSQQMLVGKVKSLIYFMFFKLYAMVVTTFAKITITETIPFVVNIPITININENKICQINVDFSFLTWIRGF